MKILKYMLVFGAPAVVCGVGWLVGFVVGMLTLMRKWPDHPPELSILWICALCASAALLSSFCWQRLWLRSLGIGQDLIFALAHQLCGAAFSACIGGAIQSIFKHEHGWLSGVLMGSILCAGVNLIFTPLQLPIAYLHIRLFRYLHARFLALPTVG